MVAIDSVGRVLEKILSTGGKLLSHWEWSLPFPVCPKVSGYVVSGVSRSL